MPANTTRTLTLLLCISLAATGTTHAQLGSDWSTDFSKHTVPLDEIVSGGPPKDGIPAVDNPRFVTVRDADRWLAGREPVVVVAVGHEAKAYPLQILIWHEIVNDEVGGTPISITYCPLCNTALAFDRRFEGRVLDFGTTGRLRHSDLVMYDRQTETWWQQATGDAIVGEYAGRRLTFVSAPLVSWETFKQAHPEGRVLSRETGFDRPYGQNPYERYDDLNNNPWRQFFHPTPDDRLPAMERVVAVTLGDASLAYPFASLEQKRVVNDDAGGTALVVFWTPGMASSVDSRSIAEGRDVGASGVYNRAVGSRTLTFEPAGDGAFRDRETGSTWDILGRAVDGELEGTQLEPVAYGNHFWFAWAVFKPETRIVR
jgi:hypothetical protein